MASVMLTIGCGAVSKESRDENIDSGAGSEKDAAGDNVDDGKPPVQALTNWFLGLGDSAEDRFVAVTSTTTRTYLIGEFTGAIAVGDELLESGGTTVGFVTIVGEGGRIERTFAFGQGAQIIVNAATADADGNLYIGGNFIGTADFGGMSVTSEGSKYSDGFLVKYAASGSRLWLRAFTGEVDDDVNAITVANDGSVYAAIRFAGTVLLDDAPFAGTGGYDVLLAKFDSEGAVLSADAVGGAGNDYPRALAVDDTGNLWLGGEFGSSAATQTTNLGGNDFVSLGGIDMFLARYNSAYEHTASIQIGSSFNERAPHILVDSTRGAWVTGRFNDVLTLSDGSILRPPFSNNSGDIFAIHFDAELQPLQSMVLGGEGAESGAHGAFLDEGGDLLLALTLGEEGAPLGPGGGIIGGVGGSDIGLVRVNPTGDIAWAASFGGRGNDVASDIELRSDGLVVVGWSASDEIVIDGQALALAGGNDAIAISVMAE